MFPLSKLVVWLIVGALAGSFTGMLVKRKAGGFGRLTNLGLGLVGAVVGGSLFNLLGIDLGLGDFSVSFQDLVAAIAGSILFLIIVWTVVSQFGWYRTLKSRLIMALLRRKGRGTDDPGR